MKTRLVVKVKYMLIASLFCFVLVHWNSNILLIHFFSHLFMITFMMWSITLVYLSEQVFVAFCAVTEGRGVRKNNSKVWQGKGGSKKCHFCSYPIFIWTLIVFCSCRINCVTAWLWEFLSLIPRKKREKELR